MMIIYYISIIIINYQFELATRTPSSLREELPDWRDAASIDRSRFIHGSSGDVFCFLDVHHWHFTW